MPRVIGYGGNVFVGDQVVHACDVVWDESSDAQVNAFLDIVDLKVGAGSNRFEQLGGLGAATLMGTDDVVLPTLASYTVLMGWAKSDLAGIVADTYRILVDDTVACATPPAVNVEVSLPALVQNVWKFCICVVVAGSFAACTVPISVGLWLQGAAGAGVGTLWLDHIVAAKQVAGIRSWSIDQVASVQDVSAYSDGQDKVFAVTQKEWSGSFEGFKNQAPLAIGTNVGLELFEAEPAWPVVPTQSWRGQAIITNCRPSSTVDGVVQYAYDFQGVYNLEVPTA